MLTFRTTPKFPPSRRRRLKMEKITLLPVAFQHDLNLRCFFNNFVDSHTHRQPVPSERLVDVKVQQASGICQCFSQVPGAQTASLISTNPEEKEKNVSRFGNSRIYLIKEVRQPVFVASSSSSSQPGECSC